MSGLSSLYWFDIVPADFKSVGTMSMFLLKIAHRLLVLFHRGYQDFLEFLLAGTCRDGMSADDVLLQTFEGIYAASDSCLAEYLRSLLE